jgi:hypothetical protein
MSPSLFFLLTLAVTVGAMIVHAVARRALRCKLAALADEWKMHYCPDDRFQLADRVAEMLPLPGAARVRVTDLIYGNEDDGYRYVFSASFTLGVLCGKKRRMQVATFRESRQRDCADTASPMILADEGLSVVEQYRKLYQRAVKREESSEPANHENAKT